MASLMVAGRDCFVLCCSQSSVLCLVLKIEMAARSVPLKYRKFTVLSVRQNSGMLGTDCSLDFLHIFFSGKCIA